MVRGFLVASVGESLVPLFIEDIFDLVVFLFVVHETRAPADSSDIIGYVVGPFKDGLNFFKVFVILHFLLYVFHLLEHLGIYSVLCLESIHRVLQVEVFVKLSDTVVNLFELFLSDRFVRGTAKEIAADCHCSELALNVHDVFAHLTVIIVG